MNQPASQHAPVFTVRRNLTLFAIVAVAAIGLGTAFLVRGSGALDLALGLSLVALGAVHAFALVGARHPLLSADDDGLTLRVGRGFQHLPWSGVRQVVVERPDSVLRDGRLVVLPRDPGQLADLGVLGRIHGVWSRRWYGAPLSVPLAMTTTCSGDDVVADLTDLADGRTDVVELRGKHLASLAEVPARLGALVSRVGHGKAHDVDAGEPLQIGHHDAVPAVPQVTAETTAQTVSDAVPDAVPDAIPDAIPVLPVRALAEPRRAETTRSVAPPTPGQRKLRTFVFDATEDAAEDAGGLAAQPPVAERYPVEPVIGPVIARARERVRLSIDELSERTRIRPHVLAAIEVDDFGPCGGDFYARGHLATLARALGLELEPLMASYDERYAHGPINARRVFEAELATGLSGGMRATVGGPKWSLLVAAVLCLMLVWGVARLFTDTPQEVAVPGSDSSSAGLAANHKPIVSSKMKLHTMTVTAAHAPTRVVVRDRTGRVLWSGNLGQGDKRKVAGLAPFDVFADNAGAAEVKVMGKELGTIGMAGTPGTKRFG